MKSVGDNTTDGWRWVWHFNKPRLGNVCDRIYHFKTFFFGEVIPTSPNYSTGMNAFQETFIAKNLQDWLFHT